MSFPGDPLVYIAVVVVLVLGAPLIEMLYAAWRMGVTKKKDGKRE